MPGCHAGLTADMLHMLSLHPGSAGRRQWQLLTPSMVAFICRDASGYLKFSVVAALLSDEATFTCPLVRCFSAAAPAAALKHLVQGLYQGFLQQALSCGVR
jgi:hypothetical protein